MRSSHTTLRRIFSLVLLLATFVGTTGLGWRPERLDDISRIDGLDGPIVIERDAAGVLSVLARAERDAQFGLGYAHAQDRLWQMEFQRRLASGRTAEFLGAAGLKFDPLLRTVGLRRAAEATWAKLGPADRQLLQAYVAGINLYLSSTPPQQLPPEFGILGVQPEPWTPVDVLAFAKLFTWSNGSNWEKELLRRQLVALLGPERAAQLTPAYTADGPFIIPAAGRTKNQEPRIDYSQAELLDSGFSVLGSLCCWSCIALSPSRPASAQMGAAAMPGC